MLRLLILCFALMPLLASATVYRHVGPDGNVTYSDQPSSGSEKVKLPPESTVHRPSDSTALSKVLQPQKAKADQTPEKDYYKAFAIQSPVNQMTFQNQRQIPVTISVDPSLRDTDRIQLYVDGKSYGAPKKDGFLLDNLDRGSHTLSAKLINNKGRTIKDTGSITIYIHYTSIRR